MRDFCGESKCLASYAVFGELYNNGKRDIYEIISEFILETIISNGKHQFTLTSITELVNKSYGFNILESVIKTSIKKLDFVKLNNKIYTVEALNSKKDRNIELNNLEIQNRNNLIINNLFSFIQTEGNLNLAEKDKEKVVNSFCSFLLEDTNGHEYSELISAFIIKNQDNSFFVRQLESIKEGVVLYAGLNYNNNLNNIGKWKKEIVIYLETEVLFHFAGYNGEVFKMIFGEFYNLIKEINSSANKRLITLKYFREVKDEVEKFFKKAEYIVCGNEKPAPNITAMNSIIDGCNAPTDVLAKKTDFFSLLSSNQILEDDNISYYDSNNYKHNIEDTATLEQFNGNNTEDTHRYLKFLNYINILRKGNSYGNFEDVGYVLLTENTSTLRMSKDKSISTSISAPLAVSLYFITNRFWFKLNKGFGARTFPKTFNAITQAQIVLSKHLSDSIGKKYEELQFMCKNGDITQEIVMARIVDLRNQTKKPEEIAKEDIDTILDNLSEDSIEKFIDEQDHFKNKFKENQEENIELKNIVHSQKEEIRNNREEKRELEKKILRGKIEVQEKLLLELKGTKEVLEEQLKTFNEEANKKFRHFKIIIGLLIVVYYGFLFFLIYKYSWNKMEMWTYIFSAIPVGFSILFLLIFEKTINPIQFLEKRKEHYNLKVYKSFKFNKERITELNLKISSIDLEIEDLKNSLIKLL